MLLSPFRGFISGREGFLGSKRVFANRRWRAGSASAERVGQGEVGGVTRRVLCTWQLLGLAAKGPWLAPGGPTLGLAA